jgi:glucan-binding YG repeat protein
MATSVTQDSKGKSAQVKALQAKTLIEKIRAQSRKNNKSQDHNLEQTKQNRAQKQHKSAKTSKGVDLFLSEATLKEHNFTTNNKRKIKPRGQKYWYKSAAGNTPTCHVLNLLKSHN